MKTSLLYLVALAALTSAYPTWESHHWKHWHSQTTSSQQPASPASSSATGDSYSSGTGTGSYAAATSTSSSGSGTSDTDSDSDSADTYGSGSAASSSAASSTAAGSASAPSSTGTTTPSNGTVSSGSISLPAGCATLNGIGIGWLPDADQGLPLTTITSALNNEKPCFAGYYAQITSSSWDGSQLTGKIAEVKAGGAPYPIFVASVMPSIPMSEVPSAASSITSVMKELTDAGLTVWLRFAHEMNWYDSSAGGYVYPQSSIADYQTAWAAVSAAVATNDAVKMFWSPNSASAASLKAAGWYPTGGAVDVIGVDIYPPSGSTETFSDVYQSFCSGWPSVPFAIGETASGGSSADKTFWLQQLTSVGAKQACPNYVGYSWFEYNKEADFLVATDGNTEAQSVLGE